MTHHASSAPLTMCALVAASLLASAHAQAVPAFPGAEGFGANATGGRGGTVYIVTNLNDSGAGSFRDAVSQPNRTVVFAVGGIIRITSRIAVKPNVTIAGQTAPGDGITIYGNGISFSGADNAVVRYIRFRQGIGGDSGTDAVSVASGSNMVFDHVSASWGRDETFSVTSTAANVTLQDCIVGQGLLIHSAGGLMEPSGPVSVFRSFYADNWMRNPKVKGTHEFTNNVVYNWGSGGAYICGDSAGQSYPNIVNNLFVGGQDSGTTPAFIRGNLNFHAYAAGNVQDVDRDGALAPVAVHPNDFTVVDAQAARHAYPEVATLLTPQQALAHVVANAGASLHRDSVDSGMIAELLSFGTQGTQIANESEVGGVGTIAGGLAAKDTDSDGMPDWWEEAAGTNPSVADNNGDLNGDGYTNLENYLNTLASAGLTQVAITGITADTGTSATDGVTSDATLVLSGTAVPGSAVTLSRVDTGVIGTTTADASGNWTFDYSGTVLPDRYYAFTAMATVDGRVSTPSRAFAVKVDSTAAAAPAIGSIVVTPAFTINGSAEPQSIVTVTLVGVGPVGTITADALGNWSIPYAGDPLPPGVYSFTAAATDLAGNAGPESAPYVVDTSVAPPAFSGITTDSGVSASDQITKDTTLVIGGTGPAGAVITVTRVGLGVVGTSAADAAGAWSFDYTGVTLTSGQYTFMATATTGGSASPASPPFVVTVDTAAPTIPSIERGSPTTAATSASTLVFRVTWNEPVQGVDTGDFQLTVTGGVSGTIATVTPVSASVYDVTVTGVAGDGTIRLDRKANATVVDYAGNSVSTATFTGGQVYAIRAGGSGVWINGDSDGLWSDAANWDPVWGGVANGATATADFSTLDLGENRAVQLDAPRTIGRLVFGDVDQSSPAAWTLTDAGNPANALTMASTGTPTIQAVYTGATADSNAVIAAAGSAYPTTIDVALTSTDGLAKTGWGTASLVRPVSMSGALAVTEGYLRLAPGAAIAPTGGTIGTSAQLQIAGGTFTTPGTVTIANGGTSGIQLSNGTATINKITTTGDRDGVVRISGGVATIGEIALLRTSNSESEAATFSRAGFFVQGGVANVGTLTIPSGNSWSALSVEGGELNVSGAATLGNQVTAARGALARVTGGRFTVTDPTNGLVLSKLSGTNANNVVKVSFLGGVSTLEKLTLGFDASVTAGAATVTLNGGAVYLGSGGIVKNATSGMATTINLTSGILGAKADWTTGLPLVLTSGNSTAIKTADETDVPKNIALGGILEGAGGFTQTGTGTLTLTAANTFTGPVVVSGGTLRVHGSLATGAPLTLNAGGTLSGIGSLARPIALNAGGRLVPGSATPGSILTGESLAWDGGGQMVFDLTSGNQLVLTGALTKGAMPGQRVVFSTSAPLAYGTLVTLATFASTDLTPADLAYLGLTGYRGVFVIGPTSLQFLVTGVGATAEYTHWAHLAGLPADQSAADQDPDNDGISNLLEFALGHDPLRASVEGLQPTVVDVDGRQYPAVVFARRVELGGVTTDMLISPNLAFETRLEPVEVSTTALADGMEQVVVRSAVPLAREPRQFFRLAATLPVN